MNIFETHRKRSLWSAAFWLFLGLIICLITDNPLVFFGMFFIGYIAGVAGEKYQSSQRIYKAVQRQELKVAIESMPPQHDTYFSEN